MKKLIIILGMYMSSLTFVTFGQGPANAANQSNGAVNAPNITPSSSLGSDEIFRFGSGAITQLVDGTSDFTFGPTDEWLTLGKVPTGGVQTFYGSRFQFKESAFVTGYTSTSPTKPRIQWIHNGGTTADFLEFRVGNGFGSAGSQGTNTLVASMSPLKANTYFGDRIDISNPFGDNVNSPKVGVDTDGKLGLSIRCVTAIVPFNEKIGARIEVENDLPVGTGLLSNCYEIN